jgi:ATP phosphoribosyltransferase
MTHMSSKQLIIGMPAGSLADSKRGGNLIDLLEKAGFKTKGYDSGGPSTFASNNFLFGWDGRPQEFGSQLGIGELDVAIAGDDWIQERILELRLEYNTPIELEKVLSLKRGGVRLVGITNAPDVKTTEELLKNLIKTKKIITVVSEMPYLALNWIQNTLKKMGKYDEYASFSVQKYKTPSRIEKGILIYETWGKTEAKVKNGGADLGLEITQSGSAIRNYGLTITETVLESESGIYINPLLKKDKEKTELLKMFLLNLYGVVNAENKVMILFNVSNEKVADIERYLGDNELFADEPTKNIGKSFTEFSIQVNKENKKQSLAMVRYELAKRGAANIDTLPIDSSIQNMDVLKI